MAPEDVAAGGISCDACGLVEKGLCTYGGPGDSEAAKAKLESERNLFGGSACPVLTSAVTNQIPLGMRDCPDFPGEHYESALTGRAYPFPAGFIAQPRRRRGKGEP